MSLHVSVIRVIKGSYIFLRIVKGLTWLNNNKEKEIPFSHTF